MSGDRELLERAAQAAGIAEHLQWWETSFVWKCQNPYVIRRWNPLTDDGDAPRLAVKLGVLDLQWAIASAWQASTDEASAAAATRRAIVRAAAAMAA
jgi:hypothetical protein